MKKVLVMLSTYNGEKYLHEQLDSVYAQEGVDVHILVRDDGSSDNTLAILKDYQERKGNMTLLKETNIGPSRSFYRLMYYACYEMNAYDFYSFCDQDDVWFSYKLETSCNHLLSESGHPQLFYAPAVPVDAILNPVRSSSLRVVNCLGANIVSNRSLGCTQVFNRALLQKIVRICEYVDKHAGDNIKFPLHDAWTALVAYSIGDVVLGDVPLMLYRQHGNNVVGSSHSGVERFKSRIMRYLKRDRVKSLKCQILQELFVNEIPKSNAYLIDRCANYRHSLIKRLHLAFTKDIYHYGFTDNLGVFIVVVLNRF